MALAFVASALPIEYAYVSIKTRSTEHGRLTGHYFYPGGQVIARPPSKCTCR